MSAGEYSPARSGGGWPAAATHDPANRSPTTGQRRGALILSGPCMAALVPDVSCAVQSCATHVVTFAWAALTPEEAEVVPARRSLTCRSTRRHALRHALAPARAALRIANRTATNVTVPHAAITAATSNASNHGRPRIEASIASRDNGSPRAATPSRA